jgi:hypothetical protein
VRAPATRDEGRALGREAVNLRPYMKHRVLPFLYAALLALPLVACSDDSTAPDDDGPPAPQYVGAKGVTIREVSIYQSLKRQLMVDGAPVEGGVPLVQGRDAVIRVFYDTNADYAGGEVTARLEIAGADPIEIVGTLDASSSEDQINSTINFSVPGAAIGASLEYSISILEEGQTADDNAAAHYPASGTEAVAVDGPANTFRVILAPFRYDADGSGREPDMSEATVESYRQRLKQLYPVSNVEVTVREVTPWNQELDAFGNGWQELGYELYGMRAQDNAPDDVYYYAIFNPSASFNQYCSQGCLLGVTLLNADPPDVGQVDLRFAMGVGYPEYAADTMAHELGHAHGREHADCGGPDQPDPQFPHPGGQIGVWGLDTVSLELKPPTLITDIMGYCDNQWVSDYTYSAFLNRGKNVNLPRWHGPKQRVALVGLDGKGVATFGGFRDAAMGLQGKRVQSRVTHHDGRVAPTDGVFYAWDHLPGGMVLVPVSDESVDTLELELEGVRHVLHTGP